MKTTNIILRLSDEQTERFTSKFGHLKTGQKFNIVDAQGYIYEEAAIVICKAVDTLQTVYILDIPTVFLGDFITFLI